MSDDKRPAKRGLLLQQIRREMAIATDKYRAGGRPNDKIKPVTLRRADYERQRATEQS